MTLVSELPHYTPSAYFWFVLVLLFLMWLIQVITSPERERTMTVPEWRYPKNDWDK